MVSDHDLDETVSRCLAVAIYYDWFEERRTTKAEMSVEVRAVADHARKLGLQDQAVLSRLDAELSHRFDDAARRRINAGFAKSYRRAADLVPSLAIR